MKLVGTILAAAVLALLGPAQARADDTLKVAIGQINNWENQMPTLGQQAGIFKKHGLVLDLLFTQGSGETMQAVIAGSVDVGVGVDVGGMAPCRRRRASAVRGNRLRCPGIIRAWDSRAH